MFVGIGTKAIIDFVLGVIIGRKFGTEVLGTYAIANTFFSLLSIVSIIGLNLTLNRFIPILKDNKKKLSEVIGTALKYTAIIGTLSSAIIFLAAPWINDLFRSTDLNIFLKILILSLPAFAITRILVSIMTSLENARYEAIIEKTLNPLITLIALGAFLILGSGNYSIPYAILIANLAVLVIALKAVSKKIRKIIDPKTVLKSFEKKYLLFSLPLFLNNLLLFLTLWVDSLLLAYFSNEDQVGIYSIAKKVGSLPVMTITAFNIVFLPTISKIVEKNEHKLVQMYYKDSVRILIIFTLPITVFLSIFSKEILSVFGKDFSVGTTALTLIGIGTFLNIASGPVGKLLIAYKRQKVITISTLISFLISSVFSIILIPKYGIIGAGVSFIIGELLQNYVSVVYLYKLKGLVPYSKKNLRLIISMIFVTIITYSFKCKFPQGDILGNELLDQIAYILVGGIIYTLLCILFIVAFKAFKQKDYRLLRNIVRKIKR